MNENIEILQRQFDAYCTKVLKYASISYYSLYSQSEQVLALRCWLLL